MIWTSDFSWLPHSLLKGISRPLPKIVYVHNDTASGWYDTTKNIIAICDDYAVPSTIAHEFKHFLQYLGPKKLTVLSWAKIKLPYEQSIRFYFRNSWSEMDALLFECKYAKNDVNYWWLKKLVME